MTPIFWFPLGASVLHIGEEFVFPGGFADWDRAYRPAYGKSINTRLHVFVNGLLIVACLAVGAAGPTPSGVAGWLTLAALLASNAVFHLVGTIKTGRYSPGLVTGLLLYVPMAVFGYAHFVRAHLASVGTAVVSAALGGSYHLWASMAHARRSRHLAPAIAFALLAAGSSVRPARAAGAASPERTAAIIETLMPWALEGKDIPSDPPQSAPALPHRSCDGKLDPQNLPATIYVAWDLSAEAQHAACNWKYDVASHRASPLTPAEAADLGQRIVAGAIGSHERAFFHSTPQKDARLRIAAGYCWGSASGTFAFREGRPVLVGELTIHGY